MNYVKKVAHMLGVLPEEHFRLGDDTEYLFTKEDGLCFVDEKDGKVKKANPYYLDCLIRGVMKIDQPPFSPVKGQEYWKVLFTCDPDLSGHYVVNVAVANWNDNSSNFADKKTGNCFRSFEEAEEHMPALFNAMVPHLSIRLLEDYRRRKEKQS